MSVEELVRAGYKLVSDPWGGFRAVRDVPGAGKPEPAPPGPGAVTSILERRFKAPWRTLGPEDRIQAELVRTLDNLTASGLPVLAVMVGNEVRLPIPPVRPDMTPETARLRGWLERVALSLGGRALAMGLLPGFPDLIVVWRTAEGLPGIAFMESKIPGGDSYLGKVKGEYRVKKRARGSLSDEQKIIIPLLLAWGFNVCVYHGEDEGMERLRSWGAPV